MEFSLVNVNLNIDRKLFIFMCAGLMLTVVLSDESNPVANILRSIPPISLVDQYAVPLIKNAIGYFRGYGTMSGTIGTRVPINFVPTAEVKRDVDGGLNEGRGDNSDASQGNSVLRNVKDAGLMMDSDQALSSFSTKKSFEAVDEESMPKSHAEMTKETAEDARESAQYSDGEQTFRKGKRKFKVKK